VKQIAFVLYGLITFLLPYTALASQLDQTPPLNLTETWIGISAVIIFVFAYVIVISEEVIHLRKSKPVMVAAGVIWVLVAIAFNQHGDTTSANQMLQHNILEYAELLLFLLAAMTYVNTMEERNVFASLRSYLASKGSSLQSIYWLTGLLAFVLSPVAGNLAIALVMGSVVMAVAKNHTKFVTLGCINVVVAANAGGTFSPFGGITTLMVWQKEIVEFTQFFTLFLPSLVNWIVPAAIMAIFLPKGIPEKSLEAVQVKQGGFIVVALFLITVAMTVALHNYIHLPSMLGMMTGLGMLKLYGYWLKMQYRRKGDAFDIFHQLQRAEWDTLMFFYGVILCVGGLGALGYLNLASHLMYEQLGSSWANISVGLLSAVFDKLTLMYAVLNMMPAMDNDQWLLVTLTAGVGGSLLSIGSPAGVALMGQARGRYTFFSHLKWSWAILLGYIASIATHFWLAGISLV